MDNVWVGILGTSGMVLSTVSLVPQMQTWCTGAPV